MKLELTDLSFLTIGLVVVLALALRHGARPGQVLTAIERIMRSLLKVKP